MSLPRKPFSRASAIAFSSVIARFGEFFADVDVGGVCADGEGGDDHALDELVRILVDDVAVLEGAGLGFVSSCRSGRPAWCCWEG